MSFKTKNNLALRRLRSREFEGMGYRLSSGAMKENINNFTS
jgi:hypothetical protein